MGVNDFIEKAIAKAIAKAKRKYLDETFNYLKEINSEKKFKCVSQYPQIDGAEFSLVKNGKFFNYATKINFVKGNMSFNNNSYGLIKEFKLVSNDQCIEIPFGIKSISANLGDPITAKGDISELECSLIEKTKNFFRLILEKEDNILKSPKSFIESEALAVNNNLQVSGLMEIKCGEEKFNVFDYSQDDRHYLFIDAMVPVFYSSFEKATAAILYSIGFLTGYVPRDQKYVLQSEDNTFKKITGFKFSSEDDSISSNMEVVSPMLLSMKSNVVTGHVSLKILSNICTKAFIDKRFLRTLRIICEGNTYPLEIRASTYSVALETIKNIVNEEYSEKINPFKNKKYAETAIKTLTEAVSKMENENFNNKDVVIKKLKQLNQVTNKDSFKMAFEMCGMKLSSADEDALLLRNDFLHGRLPFENEEEFKHNQELKYITYKLHFLVSILIMKYCKYEGFILNSPKLFSVLAPDGKEIKEPLFVSI